MEQRIQDVSQSCRSQVPDKSRLDLHSSIYFEFLLVTLTDDELRMIETDPNSASILAIYRSSRSLFDVSLILLTI